MMQLIRIDLVINRGHGLLQLASSLLSCSLPLLTSKKLNPKVVVETGGLHTCVSTMARE